jgi:glutamate-1-semialdehyde 2,1-aminomutase
MFGLFFTEEPGIERYEQVISSDVERFRHFFHGLLREGVYLAPSPFEAGFVSGAHTEDVIATTLTTAERVLAQLPV